MICLMILLLYAYTFYRYRTYPLRLSKEACVLVVVSFYFYRYYRIPWRYFPVFMFSLLLGLWLICLSHACYQRKYQEGQAELDFFLALSSYYREQGSLLYALDRIHNKVDQTMYDKVKKLKMKVQEESIQEAFKHFSSHYLIQNFIQIILQDQNYGNQYIQEHLLTFEKDLLTLKFNLKDYDERLKRFLRQMTLFSLLTLVISALSYHMLKSIDVLTLTKKEFLLYRFFIQSNFLIYVFAHQILWEPLYLKEELIMED